MSLCSFHSNSWYSTISYLQYRSPKINLTSVYIQILYYFIQEYHKFYLQEEYLYESKPIIPEFEELSLSPSNYNSFYTFYVT